jgi:hypothetical protein
LAGKKAILSKIIEKIKLSFKPDITILIRERVLRKKSDNKTRIAANTHKKFESIFSLVANLKIV